MADKIFVDGMYINVHTSEYGEMLKLSFKVDKFKEWLDEHVNEAGYVNVDIKNARSGNKYGQLSTYTPKDTEQSKPEPKAEPKDEVNSLDDSDSEDMPF